jgi:hypothetical protein
MKHKAQGAKAQSFEFEILNLFGFVFKKCFSFSDDYLNMRDSVLFYNSYFDIEL